MKLCVRRYPNLQYVKTKCTRHSHPNGVYKVKEIKIKKCKFELKWGDDMAYFSNILEKIKGDIELSDFESVRKSVC